MIQVKADSFHGSTIAIHNLEDAARAGTVATHRQVIQVSSKTYCHLPKLILLLIASKTLAQKFNTLLDPFLFE